MQLRSAKASAAGSIDDSMITRSFGKPSPTPLLLQRHMPLPREGECCSASRFVLRAKLCRISDAIAAVQCRFREGKDASKGTGYRLAPYRQASELPLQRKVLRISWVCCYAAHWACYDSPAGTGRRPGSKRTLSSGAYPINSRSSSEAGFVEACAGRGAVRALPI